MHPESDASLGALVSDDGSGQPGAGLDIDCFSAESDGESADLLEACGLAGVVGGTGDAT